MSRLGTALATGLGTFALLLGSHSAVAKSGTTHLPDLVVIRISKTPATSAAGSRIRLMVEVRNEQVARAERSRLGIYLAPKARIGKPKGTGRLTRVKVKALAPRGLARLRLELLLPANSPAGAYRLIACADDAHELRESKESNDCRASKTLRLTAPTSSPTSTTAPTPSSSSPPPPPPPPAPPSGRPAFTVADGLSWGFAEDAERHPLVAGDPVTVTLRAANGLAGQAGYARSEVAEEPLLTGLTTTLDFGNQLDDGTATVELPFDFPFGGIDERSASVSTNGWIEFGGSPALDYWDDHQASDYRGAIAVLGNLERGIMPYMGDLALADLGAGTGSVKMVVPPSNDSVAFQWDVGQSTGGGAPRRVFQLVLFPDGRFRFDYPGINASGGHAAFIGYTLGTGSASVDAVDTDVEAVPASSLLFTPSAVPSAGPLPAGEVTLTLPVGSGLVSADPGCSVVTVPSPLSEGREGKVSCPIPSLAPGVQATRHVTFSMPANAPGWTHPSNFRYLGSYLTGGTTLIDGDEIDALERNLEDTTLEVDVQFISATPEVSVPATFKARISAASGGMDEPQAMFILPANSTLDSIEISGRAIPCSLPAGGQVTCKLPSGAHSTEPIVTVTPGPAAEGNPLTLSASAEALNAPPHSGEGSSPSTLALALDPILFVHGWARNSSDWSTMIERFEGDGWPSSYLSAYSYDTSQSNKTDAENEVKPRVEVLLEATGAEKVDIIAHSMGSLNSRWYIKELGGEATIDDWVSLGGPNHGTSTAALCPSTACQEMLPGSIFLSELNAGDETPGAVSYGTWWSPCDEVVSPVSSVPLEGATNHETACISHLELLTSTTVYEQVRDFVK